MQGLLGGNVEVHLLLDGSIFYSCSTTTFFLKDRLSNISLTRGIF